MQTLRCLFLENKAFKNRFQVNWAGWRDEKSERSLPKCYDFFKEREEDKNGHKAKVAIKRIMVKKFIVAFHWHSNPLAINNAWDKCHHESG